MILAADSWTIASRLALSWVVYIVAGAVYRLYFSPIAKFPGPKLAALTFWYEFYYDVVKKGRYAWEIKRMHEKYGPIVRINPYELHVITPDFFETLYSGGSTRRDKWAWSANMFGNPLSVFATVPHDHHRIRRVVLNPYFSKRSVVRLEPLIQNAVENLCRRMEEFKEAGEVFPISDAYTALTMDVITEYCFAKSYNNLLKEDFGPEWPSILEDTSQGTHLVKQCGWLLKLMRAMPTPVIARLVPNMMQIINFQTDIERQIKDIMDGRNDHYKTADHPTIFQELLNSNLSADEKSLPRLVSEGHTLVGAGTHTTRHFLETATYYILANPGIHRRLRTELETLMPEPKSPASLLEIEQLPYLSAIIKEISRLSHGISHRSQRVSPDAPLFFNDWVIPPGTPVSMTAMFIHDNPDIFAEPAEFRPERWLRDGLEPKVEAEADKETEERLDRYVVNFSKGSRSCLGMNLAKAEIHLTMAAVFRRFDMDLFETTREDVDVAHDFFNPRAKMDSKGVRVVLK